MVRSFFIIVDVGFSRDGGGAQFLAIAHSLIGQLPQARAPTVQEIPQNAKPSAKFKSTIQFHGVPACLSESPDLTWRMDEEALPAWKPALDAITGARHGGQVETVLDQLKALDAAYPHVGEINYQIAWTLETLDRESQALPYYEHAIALGLPPNELSGALIGLGSTLRNIGELDRASATLESGQRQFPDQPEFDAFLALVRHDQGHHAEALKLALSTLLDTTEDPGITAYQRTLRFYVNGLT
jgi:tetratricopeptide (TPR) repeat protein